MRNLDRDRVSVYISRYEGVEPQVDANGRLTGKNSVKRSVPCEFLPTSSMARGEAQGAYFGVNLDYDRVLTIDDPTFEVAETDVLWIDKEVGDLANPSPHDFVVKKVARQGDYTVIAVSRVEVRK